MAESGVTDALVNFLGCVQALLFASTHGASVNESQPALLGKLHDMQTGCVSKPGSQALMSHSPSTRCRFTNVTLDDTVPVKVKDVGRRNPPFAPPVSAKPIFWGRVTLCTFLPFVSATTPGLIPCPPNYCSCVLCCTLCNPHVCPSHSPLNILPPSFPPSIPPSLHPFCLHTRSLSRCTL